MSKSPWENFAAEDAYTYIHRSLGKDPDAFWESGVKQAKEIFKTVESFLPGRRRVIEIGCGAGRLLLPMGERFDKICGVDIATGMLKLLTQNANRQGTPAIIQAFLSHEAWDEEETDLIYSVIALQHVEAMEDIRSYIFRAAKALSPGGVGYLHFDTRPRTLPYWIKTLAPDFILPKKWHRTARRVRRSPKCLRSCFEMAGLRIRQELCPDSLDHVFVVQRP